MRNPALRSLVIVLAASAVLLLGSSQGAARADSASGDSVKALCAIPAQLDEKVGSPKNRKRSAAQLDIAAAAYQKRSFAEAIPALHEAYRLDPQIEILFNLAQACRELGLLEEALLLYSRTLSESKDDTTRADCERHIETLHNKLAGQEDERAAKFLRDKEYALAVSAWESAYKQNPNANYLFQIAQAQRLGGQIDNAIASYQRFLDKAPESAFAPEARERLAGLLAGKEDARAHNLFDQKQYTQAISTWEEAYRISPQTIFLFRIAESQRLGGDKAKALSGYERFLKQTPENEQKELRAQAQEQCLAIRTGTVIGRQQPVYKKWWFWTLIGGAVTATIVGGVVGGVLSRPPDPFAAIPPDNQRNIFPQ